MATKKPTAKPAAKKAEPAAAAFEVGQNVLFKGYGDDVPAEEQHLTEGHVYPVAELTEDGHPVVRFANPSFDPSKKEDPKKNPATLEVECFPEEVEVTDEAVTEDAEADAETTEDAAEAVEEAAPAKTKAPAKGKAKTTEAAPAETTKAKASAKPAPTKAKAKTEAPAEETEGDDGELAPLENEDPEVLALVEGSEDLIGTAQELEANVATTEYQLGGVLRHILQTKAYQNMEQDVGKGKTKRIADFDEPGGFKLFLSQYFNMGYRKAMYLIQIYESFTLAQIENPAEAVAQIGWTKASKIAALLIEEGANVEELLELAAENTVEELSVALKEQVKVGGTAGEPGTTAKRITLKFRLWEEEGASVNAILEEAATQLGLKDIGEAMAHIVQEWGANAAGGTAEQEDAPAQTAPAKKTTAKAPVKRATAKA